MGGKRPPQFYMPSYEAEIPESQKKDSDIISVKAKSFADREIRYTLKAQGQVRQRKMRSLNTCHLRKYV